MRELSKIGALAAAALIVALGFSSSAYAASTSNLAIVIAGDDRVYNYDFLSNTSATSTNVDWPVDMVFCNNANIDKIKNNIYWGIAVLANPMYSKMSDNSGATYVWDTDQGTKLGFFYSAWLGSYVNLHMRLYAPNPPDYLTNNAGLGKWIVGTAHYDQWPSESWSGYSEYAEADLSAIALGKGYPVLSENMNWFNAESFRQEGSHYWLNSGDRKSVV